MKTGFKKLEYQFLVENRKIENTIFPHKITKNKDHKERSFASNYFIFKKKNCFSLRSSYKEWICYNNYTNVHIHKIVERRSFILRMIFPYCWTQEFYFEDDFSMWVSLSQDPNQVFSFHFLFTWWITFFKHLYSLICDNECIELI